jgi:AcrR family transcriptional regulator
VTTSKAAGPVDGRAARRDRGKTAVLDAVVALFSEDNLDPTPEQVATRSGRSLSSVYRYFEDRDDLLRSAMERQLEQVTPLLALHAIGQGPLDERIEALVTGRLRVHAEVGATARASRVRAATNKIFRERVDQTRRALSEQVDKQFAPELKAMPAEQRRSAAAAADALCQLETIDLHRLNRGLSEAETHTLLVAALHTLLAPPR